MPTVDESLEFLIRWMRAPADTGEYPNYGYDVYVPNVARAYVRQEEGVRGPPPDVDRRAYELSADFMAAAWELCRLGVLRPGIKRFDQQATDHGSAGNGYSIMPAGREWLSEFDDHFIPTQPAAFARLLEPFRARFGPGFHQRAQEAVKCRWAGANLACCAMCGAAAESILLALAIARTGDESQVLQAYRSSNGRSRVRNLVFGQASGPLQRQSQSFTDLLDYWRDEASHGQAADFSQFEAYEALARLLRFAHFADDHWDELTNP